MQTAEFITNARGLTQVARFILGLSSQVVETSLETIPKQKLRYQLCQHQLAR